MDDFFKLAAKAEGGIKVVGYVPKFDDPIDAARFNFAKNAKLQMSAIKDGKLNDKGEPKGSMFEKLTNGSYRIILKNGNKTIRVVPDKEFFILKTAKEAAAFLESAIAASEAGKFDEQFKATLRKTKGDAKAATPNVIDSAKSRRNGATQHA